MQVGKFRLDIRENFFTRSVVHQPNKLLMEIMASLFLAVFKI